MKRAAPLRGRGMRRSVTVFNHIFIGTNDADASKTFYDATMGVLGHHGFTLPYGIGYAGDGGSYIIARPANGEPASVMNGFTFGLKAADYAQVDAWHAAGLANGGSDEGAPGFRPNSPGNMYGAYLRDPDGHKICAYAPNVGER
jgi:catechol 2,3-dioxygenase-like lactoylglutathione lyase family enzyme